MCSGLRATRLFCVCAPWALAWLAVIGCAETGAPFGGGLAASGGGTAASGAVGGGGGEAGTGAQAGAGATGAQGGTGGGGTGGGAGAAGGAGGSCGHDVQPMVAAELDWLVLVDQSASMADSNKWAATSSALQAYVSSAQSGGIGVGLQYFPVPPADPQSIPVACTGDPDCGLYGPCEPYFNQCSGSFSTDTSCDPVDYHSPEEPIALLPAAASQLVGSLQAHDATGSSTPTEPAMEGAATYATGWAQAHPGHLSAIVLITDGEPTNCTENTVAGAANAAAMAQGATPSVSTFVIGIEPLLVSLDPIAQAGATGLPRLVAAGSEQEMLAALGAIRDSRRCSYPIPPPAQGPPDFALVNVVVTDPAHPDSPTTVANVANDADCNPVSGGWHYDDPSGPHRIVLCPATCQDVTGSGLDVSVVHGCPTVH
jgi:hypothetical protein